jgi:hypothetical protein
VPTRYFKGLRFMTVTPSLFWAQMVAIRPKNRIF